MLATDLKKDVEDVSSSWHTLEPTLVDDHHVAVVVVHVQVGLKQQASFSAILQSVRLLKLKRQRKLLKVIPIFPVNSDKQIIIF